MKKVELKLTPQYTPKGQLAKLGIKDPEALASQILRDFSNAEQTKWLWIPQRAEDLKNYYGVTPPAEWPFKGASRVKSQFQRIVVDTLSGNLIKSLFSPEKPIRVNPAPLGQGSSNDTLDNLEYVENLHNSLQSNEYNLKQVLDKAIPTSLIESFIVLHPVYEYQTNTIIESVKRWLHGDFKIEDLTYDLDTDTVSTKDGQTVHSMNAETSDMTTAEMKDAGLVEVQFDINKEECVKDGISVKMINGYRFYMPLGTPGENPYEKVSRAPYVIHELFYTVRETKDYIKKGYFENVDPVVATVYDRQRELLTYIKLQEAGFLLDTARLEYEYSDILKWCGKWEIDGVLQELTVWMDKGSSQILRAEKNVLGMRPYFPLVPFPVDETPYGESLCQIIRSLVKEIDLLMRTITNIALMKSAPPKFFDPASGFNPGTIGNFGPNSWIPAREPAKNILQPQSPEDPQAAMQMLQFLINIVERITGVNEVIQGQLSKKANTTAHEVDQATMRSGVRFDTIYDRFKDQLKPMLKYIHKLTLFNMPDSKEVALMGKENAGKLAKIHKAQLQGDFEFNLSGGSVVAEQGELQKAMTLYQTLGQHPYLSYKPESIYYVLYNIVHRLNPIAAEKILPKPDEIKQIEAQNQQAQRQQEQQAMQMQQQQAQNNPEMQQMQAEMQMKGQSHQMDMEKKKADIQKSLIELQMKHSEAQQKLGHNEQIHQQKMKHDADKHAQEMAMQKQEAIAQQQQQENELMMIKARARAQAQTTIKDENKPQ